jgi:hypothetical protein
MSFYPAKAQLPSGSVEAEEFSNAGSKASRKAELSRGGFRVGGLATDMGGGVEYVWRRAAPEGGTLLRRAIPHLCVGLAVVFAAASWVAGAKTKSPAVKPAKGIGTKTVNVIVLVYDPILKTKNNQRLHEYMKWSDPRKLTRAMIDDAKKVSRGYVNYKVIDYIEYDGFPTKRTGYTYDEDTFLTVWEKDRNKAVQGMTSFAKMFDQFKLRERIKKGNVSEIWLWGAPYFDWDELHWKTPGDKIPYQTDNPWFYRPYDIPDIGKTIWIMGWNYERGEDCMLESYCHRIESVLSLTVGKGIWDQKRNGENIWNRFTRIDSDFPGESEVGSVHAAPNSAGGYDWDNKKEVWTYADDWLTYPKLPRKKKLLNCDSGGWKGMTGHHMWWMTHLPKAPGVTGGFYNNWWQYIVNYDEAIKKLPPPGATFKKAEVAMYAGE